MKKKDTMHSIVLCTTVLATLPFFAVAHVKWFVDSQTIIQNETTHFSLTDSRIMSWIGILIFCILLSIVLEKYLRTPKKVRTWITTHEESIYRLFEIVVGFHFILTVALGHVIAPAFAIHHTSNTLVIAGVMSALAGAFLISGFCRMIAGYCIIILFALLSAVFGISALVEHLHIIGLALFFIFSAPAMKKKYPHINEWRIPVLRVTLGVALIALGLQEKLLHPELGLAFLETHHWNFMNSLGMTWFSNELFIISAGMTEMLFGIIFLLGTITRINTIALSLFFIATAIVLGPTEINGHLTLLSIAVFFILLGSGSKLKLPLSKEKEVV